MSSRAFYYYLEESYAGQPTELQGTVALAGSKRLLFKATEIEFKLFPLNIANATLI